LIHFTKRSSNKTFKMSKRKAPVGMDGINEDIVKALLELAEFEKNVERNRFKEKAYTKAAATIGALDHRLTSGDDAKELPGVGVKIAKKIDEILSTGKLMKLEKIRHDDTSIAINLLARVSGIGPAKAKELVDAGISTIEDLNNHKDKLNHAQKIGLKYFQDFEIKIPRAEVTVLFDTIKDISLSLDKKYILEVCGSYRRGAESSGDVDILLTHQDFKHSDKHHADLLHRLVRRLQEKNIVTDKISEGDTKFMGVAKLPEHKTYRRLDIRLLPMDEYYCGLLYFTGSNIFNTEMRSFANQKGFILNEHSLCPLECGKPGEPLPVSSEKDVFDYLDYPYKSPCNRN